MNEPTSIYGHLAVRLQRLFVQSTGSRPCVPACRPVGMPLCSLPVRLYTLVHGYIQSQENLRVRYAFLIKDSAESAGGCFRYAPPAFRNFVPCDGDRVFPTAFPVPCLTVFVPIEAVSHIHCRSFPEEVLAPRSAGYELTAGLWY